MTHPIVRAAQEAFKERVMVGSEMATHIPNAQAIAKAWWAAMPRAFINFLHRHNDLTVEIECVRGS